MEHTYKIRFPKRGGRNFLKFKETATENTINPLISVAFYFLKDFIIHTGYGFRVSEIYSKETAVRNKIFCFLKFLLIFHFFNRLSVFSFLRAVINIVYAQITIFLNYVHNCIFFFHFFLICARIVLSFKIYCCVSRYVLYIFFRYCLSSKTFQ